MKLFITGGTGFVGSHFIDKVQNLDYQIVCQKRVRSSTRIKLREDHVWVSGNLDQDFSTDFIGCDALIHFAASGVSPRNANLNDVIKINTLDSYKLIESAVDNNINKFLILGTSDEYGSSCSRYDYIPISAPLRPISNYAASKAAFFQLLNNLTYEKKIKVIYVRLFNTFGIGQYKGNLWPSLRHAALSGEDFDLTPGEQIRTFIPIEDAVNELIKKLDFSSMNKGELIIKHIGGNEPRSIKSFVQEWWNVWGANSRLNFGAIPYRKNEIMRCVPAI